jgi:F-type H+-transporting ATPase subunit b
MHEAYFQNGRKPLGAMLRISPPERFKREMPEFFRNRNLGIIRMIDLNITFVIQIVNFTIALLVLNWLIIQPVRAIMLKRREVAEGLAGEAGKLSDSAAQLLKNYEVELDAARAAAAEQREAVRRQGLEAERLVLESAQGEAHGFLQKSRREMEQGLETARRALRAQVDVLAGKVVRKVLE